jgi:hypothetical protein
MAAVVASQHPGFWHRRPDQAIHMPNMNMSGLLPYDTTPRTMTNAPSARAYQPTTSHMSMPMPMFPTAMTTSMSYQSGAFAFDSLSVNPYNMQQAFPVSYPQSIPQAVGYATTSDMQPSPTVRETRTGFAMESTPPVKSESCSPIPHNPLFQDTTYTGDHKRSSSEPGHSGQTNFSTDVDTLMRTIQAKQPVSIRRTEPAKVCHTNISRLFRLTILIGRDSVQPEAQETVPVQHARLQQDLLPEDSSRDPYSSAHWNQAFRMCSH